MHPKVVLVVSRSHWRCVSCKVQNKRTESIDQHLQSAHSQCTDRPPLLCASSQHDGCCSSDGDLDTPFPVSAILPLKALSFGTMRNPPLEKKKSQTKKSQCCGRLKKSAARKGKSTKEKDGAADTHSAGDVDDERSMDENSVLDERAVTAEGRTNKQRTGKTVNDSNIHPQTDLSKDNEKQEHKRGRNLRKLSQIKTTLTDQNADRSVAAKKKARKAERLVCKPKQGHEEDSKTNRVKEENIDDDNSETKTAHMFKGGECTTLDRHDGKKLERIDKSKIATCCVPWLLDSGRKAGEKVTKKSRRALMPEEKQAVRELYNISKYTQPVNAQKQSLTVPSETNRQYNTTVNVVDNCASRHTSEKTYQEEDSLSLHRNFLTNIFSQGTHDYLMDRSRSHENVYPSYGCSYSHQQSLYSCQAQDFYSPLQSIPPQRANMMNFQPYAQTAPPLVPASSVDESPRQQTEVRGGSGHGENIAANPSQSMTHPSACPSLTIPLATSNYQMNADSSLSLPQSALPAPDRSVKADPTSLQSNPAAADSVPQDVSAMSGHVHQTSCSVCKQTFESVGDLERHQRGVAGFSCIECIRCGSGFHGLHELNLHVFSLHETEKQAFCFVCNGDISGVEMLEKHVHKHAYDCEPQLAQMRFHDCRLCGEELPSSYSTLRTHYYQHHVAYVCCECFHYFTDLSAYKEHCRIHNGTLFLCSICGAKFESEEDFDAHAPCSEDIWAEDGKGDKCLKCGLWCPNRSVVEAHRKQHRSQEDVQAYRQGAKMGFPCWVCEKIFKNKHACRRHVKMVHEGVSCYKHYCEYCGKGFLTKGHMRDHIALHHLKIKRYSCDYCNQQFVCAPTLRRHVRKEHTKHKPYECQHCGERFFEKTPLQRHLTQHTGLAPFMCEHCGKGFYTKHSFTNHASTHSSVKDFVCSGCQKGFTRKYNLLGHIKICKML